MIFQIVAMNYYFWTLIVNFSQFNDDPFPQDLIFNLFFISGILLQHYIEIQIHKTDTDRVALGGYCTNPEKRQGLDHGREEVEVTTQTLGGKMDRIWCLTV